MTNTVTPHDTSWYEKASCVGLSSDLFFIDCSREGWNTYKKQLAQTQSICAQCDVVRECFKHAIANDESYGVWGGVDFQTRGKPNRNRTVRLRFYYDEHAKVLRLSQKLRKQNG